MDNGEIILLIFIFLIILIYIASYSKECAIVIASITTMIMYLLNMRNKKNNYECRNSEAEAENEALRLLGASDEENHHQKEKYLDYDQNLLSDYPSEPYMVKPFEDIDINEHDRSIPKNHELSFDDLDISYPGAIDLDQIESEDYRDMGHVDAKEKKIQFKMKGNVTFDLNRTKGNDEIPDEWSNDEIMDGDEQMYNNSRARALNANVRADMGTIRKKEFMDRFVTDELNRSEAEVWWGAADY